MNRVSKGALLTLLLVSSANCGFFDNSVFTALKQKWNNWWQKSNQLAIENPALYAQQLIAVLRQYRKSNDLPHLHEIVTKKTIKGAANVKALIPVAPFNTVAQMLTDLAHYFKTTDGKKIYVIVTSEVIENLCYILAAFDACSYALLTGAKTSQKENEMLVNEYLETINNAITLYERQILAKLQGSPQVKAYNEQRFNIIDYLGKKRAAEAHLYKKNSTEYRYELKVPNPISVASVGPVYAIIEDIKPIHKKNYKFIIGRYRTLLASAYKDATYQQLSKVDEQWQKMQDLTKKHRQKMRQLETQLAQLEQQAQTKTIAQITELKKPIEAQIEKTKTLYQSIIKTLQEQYEKDRKASGVYSK